MTVSKGEKIFAAVLAAIIIILFVVVIVLLATQWSHDDETVTTKNPPSSGATSGTPTSNGINTSGSTPATAPHVSSKDVDGIPCPANDQLISGNDIGMQINGSMEECGLLCYNNASCKYWSWIEEYQNRNGPAGKPNLGECYLKDGNSGFTGLLGIYSGGKNCIIVDGIPCPAKNQALYAYDSGIRLGLLRSWEECGLSCNNNASCKYWSWIEGLDGWLDGCYLDVWDVSWGYTNYKEGAFSGGRNCMAFPPTGQLLLVSTGITVTTFDDFSILNQSQVIDSNSPNTCTNLQSFPYAMILGAGGVLNGHPVICGGIKSFFSDSAEAQSSCYMHNQSINEWTLLGNLHTARYSHSTSLLNGKLWMTGGLNEPSPNATLLASTELVSQDGTISEGPLLPAPNVGHCMVTLHDGKVMILGGAIPHLDLFSKIVLIFDASDNSFTNGTELPNGLFEGYCTIFKSAMHQNRPVVLAGQNSPVVLAGHRATWILDYTLGNTWEEISDLPIDEQEGWVALPTLTGDGVIMKSSQDIYQLNCNASACNWEKLQQNLSPEVLLAVTMNLPEEYTCE